jgi:hypothetical protein
MVGVAGLLSGCDQEPVRDVDYWKTHVDERKAKVSACVSNPGQLDGTPNCINAKRAESDAVLRGKPGTVPHIKVD